MIAGEKARPAEIIFIHHLEQPFDVGPVEPADVVRGRIINKGSRRPNEDKIRKTFRRAVGGEDPDHAADGMADKNAQIERLANIEHVLRVAVEGPVTLRVISREIGFARPRWTHVRKLPA